MNEGPQAQISRLYLSRLATIPSCQAWGYKRAECSVPYILGSEWIRASAELAQARRSTEMTSDTRDLITAVHRRMSIHLDVLGSSRCASLLRAATTSNARRSRVPPGTLLDQLSTFVCRRVNPPMEARPHPSLTDLGASSEGQLTSFTAALAVMERSEHDPHRSNSSRLQSFRFRLAIADIGTIAPRFPRRPPRTEPSLPDGHYRRLSQRAPAWSAAAPRCGQSWDRP
jgi:hypothetical protein